MVLLNAATQVITLNVSDLSQGKQAFCKGPDEIFQACGPLGFCQLCLKWSTDINMQINGPDCIPRKLHLQKLQEISPAGCSLLTNDFEFQILFSSSETPCHLLETRFHHCLYIKSCIILTICITRAIQVSFKLQVLRISW